MLSVRRRRLHRLPYVAEVAVGICREFLQRFFRGKQDNPVFEPDAMLAGAGDVLLLIHENDRVVAGQDGTVVVRSGQKLLLSSGAVKEIDAASMSSAPALVAGNPLIVFAEADRTVTVHRELHVRTRRTGCMVASWCRDLLDHRSIRCGR